ncbi:Site-specific recombinase XerD [Planococcus glaciei]|uniref:tyrosine-type recombinase/integrase n=1 Tax=Planococcus glaciei TaxID=459472 RepID=UPI0008836848|nr:site-specific integrase [Planococcus glaciei]SDI41521.1 Site-specific recombinase XerD [Planococcus glaciei]
MTKNNLYVIKGLEKKHNNASLSVKTNFQYKLLAGWELQQKALGYTDKTIALNLRNIKEFLSLIDKFVWEIDREDIELFYVDLVGRNLAHSTRRKYQSNISTFLEYLRSRKSTEIFNMVGTHVPDVLDQFNKFFHRRDDNDIRIAPPKKEVLDVFFKCLKEDMEKNRKYKTVARDYVFFKLLGMTGLRIYELTMINIKDVRFDLGSSGVGKVHVRYGKGSRGSGHKPRWVPLLNDADLLLKWYIEHIYPLFTVGDYDSSPLFLSEGGSRVTRDTMRTNLRRRQGEYGIPQEEIFSAHQLRHAFATDLAETGVDIMTLSKLLGHSNIATTAGYLDASSDFVEKRIRIAQKQWKESMKILGGEIDEY